MLSFLLAAVLLAHTPASVPNTIPYNLHNEADNTDAYAIPSDTSGEEQEAEIEELDNLQKKNQTSN
ncbi:MAG: hypothetical protein H0X51_06270 [Parachlamydiaceae bacterium]|nr:hypothetical protein [Parachlamydiaceae bacterium]